MTAIIVFILAVTTMHLACLQVSKGFMLAVYCVWCLMISSFYFGKGYQSMSSLSAVFVGMPGMMVVSFLPFFNDSSVTVADLWSQRGLENEFASMRNTLILWCWGVFILMAAALLPPFRTARSLLSFYALPRAMVAVENYISKTDKPENDDEIVSNIIHILVGMHGKAGMTKFEPRMWRNEDLFTPLNDLMTKLETLGECAILKFVDTIPGGEPAPETLKLLNLSAQALVTGDVDDYAALKNFDGMEADGTAAVNNRSYLTQFTFDKAKDVRDATLVWLKALNGTNHGWPKEDGGKERRELLKLNVKNVFSWFVIPIAPTAKILGVLTLPFQPKRWDLRSFVWALEISAGYIILLVLSLYSDWTDLGIGTDASYYSGWHLLGYAYSLRPTSGGTLKKGLSRELGTIVGAFFAWVGAIVCAGTYDETATLNPYGVVAWLTVTSMVAMYFVVYEGPKAFFGPIPDNQYPIMYFIMTQSLILLEVEGGSGDRNAIVLNRIIATATGVVMAILITSIPPQIKGYDPDRFDCYFDSLKGSLIVLLESLILCDPDHDFDLDRAKLEDAKWLGDREMFYAKDINVLSWLPMYRLDPRLLPLLEHMQVTQVFIRASIDSAANAIKDDAQFFREHSELFAEFVETLKLDKLPAKLEDVPKLKRRLASEENSATVDSLKTILYRLKLHEDMKDSIRESSRPCG